MIDVPYPFTIPCVVCSYVHQGFISMISYANSTNALLSKDKLSALQSPPHTYIMNVGTQFNIYYSI